MNGRSYKVLPFGRYLAELERRPRTFVILPLASLHLMSLGRQPREPDEATSGATA